MALAYISFTEVQNNVAQFYADGGVNKYYKYVIGKNKVNIQGLEEIDGVTYSSKVFRNENSNDFNSRFLLQVPAQLFKNGDQYLQLVTYSDENGNSPNQSNVVRVTIGASVSNDEWPLIQQQSNLTQMYSDNTPFLAFNQSRNIGFAFQETAISKALFWQSILDAARVLAPVAINLLNNSSGSTSPTGTSRTPGASDNQPLQAVMPIIQAIIQAIRSNAPTGTPLVTASSLKNPLTNRKTFRSDPLHTQYHQLVAKNMQYSKAKFIDGGLITGPLLAAIAGPLLQALPALLNQQNQAKNQRDLQEQNYLANLLAQSNQADILRLLANNGTLNQAPAGVSSALPVPARAPGATATPAPVVSTAESLSYGKAAPRITISLDKQNAITVNGSPKYVYAADRKIALSIHVSTRFTPPKKPIPKAIVTVSIKKVEGFKELLLKKFYLKDAYLNSMQLLEITQEELQSLPLQEDLLVDIQFKWLDKDQKVSLAPQETGTLFLVKSFFMKGRVAKVGEVLALNDLEKYKVFWNKIWESSATDGKKWEATLSVKYYTYYNVKATSNGKIETKLLLNDRQGNSDKRNYYNGKLKSGLELSPSELNKLLPMVSPHPLLENDQLEAFASPILQNNFNKQAMVNIEMKGAKEEIGSLWTYPEINIAKYMLYKPSKTNENGQITHIEEMEVYFPELQTIHFLGLKTNQIN